MKLIIVFFSISVKHCVRLLIVIALSLLIAFQRMGTFKCLFYQLMSIEDVSLLCTRAQIQSENSLVMVTGDQILPAAWYCGS